MARHGYNVYDSSVSFYFSIFAPGYIQRKGVIGLGQRMVFLGQYTQDVYMRRHRYIKFHGHT